MRGMDDALHALTASIYDAALEPSGWPPVLSELTALLGASVAGLVVRGADGAASVGTASFGVDPEASRSYRDRYARLDPMVPLVARAAPGRVFADHDLVDRTVYERGEFYNEWARPNGHGHGLFASLAGPGNGPDRLTASVVVTRPPDAPPFSGADSAALARVAPHLRLALEVHRRLAAAALPRGPAAMALDRLAVGVILADAAGRLAWANRAAGALLGAADGVAVGPGGALRAATPAGTAALARLMAAAGRGGSGGAMEMPRPTTGRAPLNLLVAPLSDRGAAAELDDALPLAPEPRVLLLLLDPEHRVPAHGALERHLRALYGLTAAEAAVAVLAAQGEGLPAVADALGIAGTTARTHMSRILGKTGAARQAELARLVERLAVLDERE